MTHFVLSLFNDNDVFGSFGLWAFLSVGAVALFAVFIPLVTFISSRKEEREAFYKAETIRRVAEAPPGSSMAAIEFMREQNRISRIKAREGLKIGGLINIGVGIALVIFLRALIGMNIALCGLIPALIGVAMLVYVFALAGPLE
ncbi:MAG TPA: hypothetical protein VGG56_16600 [Terracidiphilus sp.]|jgi:hypothetical protein